MALEFSIRLGDIATVPSDLLLLKHASGFYGADEYVAGLLIQAQRCVSDELRLEPGAIRLVDGGGIVAAKQVLFVGTPPLRDFRYKEMRQFARRALMSIAADGLPVQTLVTTVHGAGYGLDVEEALQALIFGFQQGIRACPTHPLRQIVFVEHHARRARQLEAILKEMAPAAMDTPPLAPIAPRPVPGLPAPTNAPASSPSADKKHVFVAMPFSEAFEDVYQFGIYGPVRACGYICERVDQSAFAGNIVERIQDGIRNAAFVIADLTDERPNVYLEVGFAWGIGRPVILIARDGQRLHFDLSHHKCVFYKTIGQLATAMEAMIRALFGPAAGGQ